MPTPDPDRDLPDPGDEVDDDDTCECGRTYDNPRLRLCDACHWGPQEDWPDYDEPDDAREPLED